MAGVTSGEVVVIVWSSVISHIDDCLACGPLSDLLDSGMAEAPRHDLQRLTEVKWVLIGSTWHSPSMEFAKARCGKVFTSVDAVQMTDPPEDRCPDCFFTFPWVKRKETWHIVYTRTTTYCGGSRERGITDVADVVTADVLVCASCESRARHSGQSPRSSSVAKEADRNTRNAFDPEVEEIPMNVGRGRRAR